MPPYKPASVNWDCKSTCAHSHHIKKSSSKNSMVTPNQGGSSSSSWRHSHGTSSKGSNRPIKVRRAAAQLCSYCWDDLLRLSACPSIWVQLDLVLPFVPRFNSIAHPLSCSQQIPQQQLQPLTDLLLACDLTPTDHQPFCQFPSWESLLPSPFVATLCGVQYLMWSYFPLRLEKKTLCWPWLRRSRKVVISGKPLP